MIVPTTFSLDGSPDGSSCRLVIEMSVIGGNGVVVTSFTRTALVDVSRCAAHAPRKVREATMTTIPARAVTPCTEPKNRFAGLFFMRKWYPVQRKAKGGVATFRLAL